MKDHFFSLKIKNIIEINFNKKYIIWRCYKKYIIDIVKTKNDNTIFKNNEIHKEFRIYILLI